MSASHIICRAFLIVTLLTELAQVENENVRPKHDLNYFIERRSTEINRIYCVFCVCVLVDDVVVLARSRRPVPPSSGKTLFALADAP